jgi:hypothetical protein
MKPEGSLPHSKEPAIFFYPEPIWRSLRPQFHFCDIHFNIILTYMAGSFKCPPSLRFPD